MKYCIECGAALNETSKFCPGCGKEVTENFSDKTVTTDESLEFDFGEEGEVTSAAKLRKKEYKVLTQKDKWFSGKFNPLLLEQALNAYAKEGWILVGCATADIAGFGATRQEFVAILERDL